MLGHHDDGGDDNRGIWWYNLMGKIELIVLIARTAQHMTSIIGLLLKGTMEIFSFKPKKILGNGCILHKKGELSSIDCLNPKQDMGRMAHERKHENRHQNHYHRHFCHRIDFLTSSIFWNSRFLYEDMVCHRCSELQGLCMTTWFCIDHIRLHNVFPLRLPMKMKLDS